MVGILSMPLTLLLAGALLWRVISRSIVDFSTVPDGYDFDHLSSVVHNVQDAIVPHAQAIFFCSAFELLDSSRPGILFQRQETFHNSIVDMVGKIFELFLR
jgi:hypothetical protein